jgi:hypothetical protein
MVNTKRKSKKEVVQYVIRRGIDDRVDYNMDGIIDEYDDIVIKMVNGKEVERRPLNKKVEQEIRTYVRRMSARPTPRDEMQRVVYERMPPQNMANPPPVIIKDETSLGQHMKAGFGMGIGFAVADGVANIVGGLFE